MTLKSLACLPLQGVFLLSRKEYLFKCVASCEKAAEAQEGPTPQRSSVDPLEVVFPGDAQNADPRPNVDQEVGVHPTLRLVVRGVHEYFSAHLFARGILEIK